MDYSNVKFFFHDLKPTPISLLYPNTAKNQVPPQITGRVPILEDGVRLPVKYCRLQRLIHEFGTQPSD